MNSNIAIVMPTDLPAVASRDARPRKNPSFAGTKDKALRQPGGRHHALPGGFLLRLADHQGPRSR